MEGDEPIREDGQFPSKDLKGRGEKVSRSHGKGG